MDFLALLRDDIRAGLLKTSADYQKKLDAQAHAVRPSKATALLIAPAVSLIA